MHANRLCAFWLALALALAVPSTVHAGSDMYSPGPLHIEIRGHQFTVEVAATLSAQEHGLMERAQLASDHGMLFVYKDARVRIFWMKDTPIPLDMLFFDAQRRLINVIAAAPPCLSGDCPTYSSTAPAQYVLELRGGTAKQFGLKPGDVMELEREP